METTFKYDPLDQRKHTFRDKLVSENREFLKDKLYCEFGVHHGKSIVDFYSLYDKYELPKFFYGFDSFEGLPKEDIDKNSPWKTGQFSVNGVIHEELKKRPDINLIPGWYNETLNKSSVSKFDGKKIGIAHIDCDIYTSTIEVLEFLIQNELLCDGSLIVYDDWGAFLMKGGVDEYDVAEARAHKEISEKYNLSFDMLYREIIDPSFYIMTVFRYNKYD